MEWKKSNVSSSELEKQQEAYIKEALEMAKRSVAGELDKAAAKVAAEKAAAEKAAAEKAAAEKAAAEKAAAEKAAAEKTAAEKAAAEKAAAEKAAAEKAAVEKAAAEKAAAEKAAAEKAAAEKAAAEKAAAEKAAVEKAAAEKAAAEKTAEEEFTKFSGETNNDQGGECKKENTCCEQSGDLIDIAELKKKKAEQTAQNRSGNYSYTKNNPSSLNGYINEHNSKSPCNCPNCQRKRSQR